MKLSIFGALAVLSSTLFAQEGSLATLPVEKERPAPYITQAAPIESVSFVKSPLSFVYFKLGAADSYSTSKEQVAPGVGVGYRWNFGRSALDLSTSYTSGEFLKSERTAAFFTLPKVAYLHYLSPLATNSLYGGAGLAWGGIRTKEGSDFVGLIPSLSVGYEMQRTSAWKSFVQLDVSQAAVKYTLAGTLPRPVAELSFGGGF